MLVVSLNEFKKKQRIYLDKVDKGAEILIKKEKDDTLMSEEEFFKKIDKSLQDAKEGRVKILTPEYKEYLFGDL
jgi:hypothetical protein